MMMDECMNGTAFKDNKGHDGDDDDDDDDDRELGWMAQPPTTRVRFTWDGVFKRRLCTVV